MASFLREVYESAKSKLKCNLSDAADIDVRQDQDERPVACIVNALMPGGGLGKIHGEPTGAETWRNCCRNSTSSGFCVVSLYLSGTL
jgi:hypothetical protein